MWYGHGEGPVLFDLKFIGSLEISVGVDERVDFELPIVTHSFESIVLSLGFFDLGVDFMDLHFERIDFGSKIINSLLVDIHLNSM